MWIKTKLFFLCLVFGSHVLLSQWYVLKTKTDKASLDGISSLVETSLQQSAQKKNRQSSAPAVTVHQLNRNSFSNFPWAHYFLVKSTKSLDEAEIQAIRSNTSVEYFHQSNSYHIYSIPNDSAYSMQWSLSRIGIKDLFLRNVIDPGLPKIKIGIIDTGVKEDHPDLINSIGYNQLEMGFDELNNDKRFNGIDDDGNGFIDDWRGYDFVDAPAEDLGDWNVRDNDPADENGHGTAVAGIIGAESNNGIGISGIPPCLILPLRAFGKNGAGSDIDIASAIVYAVDNGAEVINMSFGDVIRSPLLYDAVRYAYSRNVVLVASSGNDGSGNPHYPSDFTEVISTGSINAFDSRSIFSSHGPSLDLMAPGEQIATTTMNGGYSNSFSGTSAAAPHVSALAGLIRSLELKKKSETADYVPFTNEEIRGLLVNTADDAGEPGWDEFYGAGILNASKAIQALSGSRVVIHSPEIDQVLDDNFSSIVVTALSPYLKSVSLYYGRGEQPSQWEQVAKIENRVLLNDTIHILNNNVLPDDTYILRLVVNNSKGNDVEFRQRIKIMRTPPKVLSLQFQDSVIIGAAYGSLINIRMDRNTTASLYFRKVGDLQYSVINSPGTQKNHSFVLSTDGFFTNSPMDVYCEFKEVSPTPRVSRFYLTDSIGFPIILSPSKIQTTGFKQKPFSLPAGYLLNTVIDSIWPTVVMTNYTTEGDFQKLKVFQFENGGFSLKDSTTRTWIPRSIAVDTPNGYIGVLVQDRGVSALHSVHPLTGKYVETSPLWADSNDVWASQFVDINGDGAPEIVARTGSEFRIYKNESTPSVPQFSVVSSLPNPTSPFVGDARNQFGPPRSIIGDFTHSGRREIIFADYDGDVLMYRQSELNSLNFELAGVDTSDLLEMSDYITTGDFNGDGILDFAVAGHSNLDWNEDREYDTPVWTIRVFSHRPGDADGSVSKIWEQRFVGVKTGSGYDNGMGSAKLKTTDANDALVLSFNPYVFIFQWNNSKNIFEPKWIHSSRSNNIVAYDFDSDGYTDIGFHSGSSIEFWSMEGGSQTVSVPWNISAQSIAERKIRLQWNSSTSTNKIYRGTHIDSLSLIATVTGFEWIDTTVVSDVVYYYAITAVSGNESGKSRIVSCSAHLAPTIARVTQVSHDQVIVEITQPITTDHLSSTFFELDGIFTSSSAIWRTDRSVIATFPSMIVKGNHTLRILQLIDKTGMAADTTNIVSFVSSYERKSDFFVRSANILSPNVIGVEFSDRVDASVATQADNYSVRTFAKQYPVAAVSYDSVKPNMVLLKFSETTNVSELSLRLEITISPTIKNTAGENLMSGKGQVISIAQETENVDRVVVFPNPAKGRSSISFVNIPENCRITIYSLNGDRIKRFENNTTNEGITWNMTDEDGKRLGTGVYLFRVEKIGLSGETVKTHLGKFAVIQ